MKKTLKWIGGLAAGLLVIYILLVVFNILPIMSNGIQKYVITPSGADYLVKDEAMPLEDIWLRWFVFGEEIETGLPAARSQFEGYRYYSVKGSSDRQVIYAVTPEGKILKLETGKAE